MKSVKQKFKEERDKIYQEYKKKRLKELII